jgi:hypothetical protein
LVAFLAALTSATATIHVQDCENGVHDNDMLSAADRSRPFERRFQSIATVQCFFVSDEGYMGTGPMDMMPNDIVSVLLGSDKPIVLRADGDHYTVVGPCYLSGIMHGQVVKEADEGKRNYESFALR